MIFQTMDPLNLFKVISSVGVVIVAIVCAFIVIKKNPSYWLNRFFALFYSSTAIGFLLYTIYHLIFDNAAAVIPIMISAHICYNIGMACLLMTEFILEKSERVAMTQKYIIPTVLLLILSVSGYFIPAFAPTLNMVAYNQGIVDTETPTIWFILVNLYRLGVVGYVVSKYIAISKKASGVTKVRMGIFTRALIISIIGMLLNIFGGSIAGEEVGLYLEILGIFSFMVGFLVLIRAFVLKNEPKKEE